MSCSNVIDDAAVTRVAVRSSGQVSWLADCNYVGFVCVRSVPVNSELSLL